MLTAHAIWLTLNHRPPRDDFGESWICRLLLDDDTVLETSVASPEVAATIGKLPRRSPVTVQFSTRPAKAFLATRLTVEKIDRAAS